MTAVDDTLGPVVMARISELWKWRSWYRAHPRWSSFMVLKLQHDAELRTLIGLARQARRIERARPDPMDRFKSYQDWTESEKAAAWGR